MGELDCAGSLIDGDEAGAYVEERFGLGQVQVVEFVSVLLD